MSAVSLLTALHTGVPARLRTLKSFYKTVIGWRVWAGVQKSAATARLTASKTAFSLCGSCNLQMPISFHTQLTQSKVADAPDGSGFARPAAELEASKADAPSSSRASSGWLRYLLERWIDYRNKVAKSARASLWLVLMVSISLGRGRALDDPVTLVGAGSTVPLPLYKSWSEEYNKQKRAGLMQYQPLGTSEGIHLVSTANGLGQSDFGAGEVLLSDQERTQGGLLELPVIMIAIVPVYNLPGVTQGLKFSGHVLAEIYLRHITSWNSPEIARLNPGVALPNLPIQVVYRPGGKGTNYVFTDFLSKNNAAFRAQIGRTASPKWPAGAPAERSSDMVDRVRAEAGTLGYVELQYAAAANLQMGTVQNPAGKFVKASSASINAACSAVEAPQWNRFAVSLTNAPGAESYPIASFSWIYVKKDSADGRRRAALRDLLNWVFTSGQAVAAQQGYSELPTPLLQKVTARVEELK